MNKSRVFVGYNNTANQAAMIAKALRINGIKADYVSWSTYKNYNIFNYPVEKVIFMFKRPPIRGLNRILRYYYFIKFSLCYNTFIFISPDSLIANNNDLKTLKKLGKKIIFLFTGCTERDPIFNNFDKDYICNNCKDEGWKKMFLCTDISKKKERVKFLEKYADYIISQDDAAAFLTYKKPIWFYVVADQINEDILFKKNMRGKVKIVHFPSNPLLKQSDIIIPVLERISKERDVEILIKREIWTRDRILNELESAHILVDQIGTGYGVLGIEAMARGCVVVHGKVPWLQKKVPEAPVYYSNSEKLHEDLLVLIDNRELLRSYSAKSIEFFKSYHSPESAGRYYKSRLNLI